MPGQRPQCLGKAGTAVFADGALTAVYGTPEMIDGVLDDGRSGAESIALDKPLEAPGEKSGFPWWIIAVAVVAVGAVVGILLGTKKKK